MLGPSAGQRWELADLRVGVVPSAVFTPPPGAIDATDQAVLTSLRLGDPIPAVELPVITGGTTTLGGTPGRPSAIYFWDGSCYGSGCSMATLLRALASRTDLSVLVVAGPAWTRDEIRREIDPSRLPVPIALDPDGAAYGLVGRYADNVVFLVGPDGGLEAVYQGDYGRQLDDILDAFVAGEPLPEPDDEQAEAQLP
jgi:peroxiredoxin